MGNRRTYDPGECWKIIEDAGFEVGVFGSWFSLRVDGKIVPGAPGVGLPNSGRVSISELAAELRCAEAFRKT